MTSAVVLWSGSIEAHSTAKEVTITIFLLLNVLGIVLGMCYDARLMTRHRREVEEQFDAQTASHTNGTAAYQDAMVDSHDVRGGCVCASAELTIFLQFTDVVEDDGVDLNVFHNQPTMDSVVTENPILCSVSQSSLLDDTVDPSVLTYNSVYNSVPTVPPPGGYSNKLSSATLSDNTQTLTDTQLSMIARGPTELDSVNNA